MFPLYRECYPVWITPTYMSTVAVFPRRSRQTLANIFSFLLSVLLKDPIKSKQRFSIQDSMRSFGPLRLLQESLLSVVIRILLQSVLVLVKHSNMYSVRLSEE